MPIWVMPLFSCLWANRPSFRQKGWEGFCGCVTLSLQLSDYFSHDSIAIASYLSYHMTLLNLGLKAHVFKPNHRLQNIYLFILLKIRKKKTELNELNELEYSKTPSQMTSYAHKHVFLYLHAQTNIDTLLYWSYIKS